MIGRLITELDSVDSTNNYIAKALDEGNYSWGTAILAHFQTNGRGQRAATWHSVNGKNLTFSFALPLTGFDRRAYFNLSRAISLAILATIRLHCRSEIYIKWPNDILVDHKKIAGILIETKIIKKQTVAICGIGLNINQTDFSNLPRACSLFTVSGEKFDQRKILDELLESLNREWDMLNTGDFRNLKARYDSELFGLNRTVQFKENGFVHSGILSRTTEDGRLVLKTGTSERVCQPQAIKLIY